MTASESGPSEILQYSQTGDTENWYCGQDGITDWRRWLFPISGGVVSCFTRASWYLHGQGGAGVATAECTLAVAVAACSTWGAAADIINVPGDHPTIQAAINAAVDGDEVVVADGLYQAAPDGGFRSQWEGRPGVAWHARGRRFKPDRLHLAQTRFSWGLRASPSAGDSI